MGIVPQLRNAEIQDLGEVFVSVLVDENHVLGLDVAMNDSGVVRVRKRAQDVPADVQDALPIEACLAIEQIRQEHAVEKLEHHVERAVLELSEVGNVDAVRMVDAADGKRLALEALIDLVDALDLGMKKLQRERAPNGNVLREIDAPHPSGAEDTGNSVPRIQHVSDPRCLLVRGCR